MAKNENTKEKAEKDAQTEGDEKAEVIATAPKGNGQSIVIAILATLLFCIAVVFTALTATGVIKFGDSTNTPTTNDEQTSSSTGQGDANDTSSDSNLIDNPNKRVAVKGNLVEVDNLEFYLPYAFKAGGKNKDGAYTYNLEDDDGWAQVLVYAEDSNLSPQDFLNKISPYLDITDMNYPMNGTIWVQGENANSLAYATKLNGKMYAVYYTVKLDSDATGLAMQMIPKTLYMKKIEKE